MLRTAPRIGFVAGTLATITLTGLLYLASAFFRLSFIPYDVADTIIKLTPGQIATQGIEALGAWAKIIIKVVAVAGFVLAGGGLGALTEYLVERYSDGVRLSVRNVISFGFFM